MSGCSRQVPIMILVLLGIVSCLAVVSRVLYFIRNLTVEQLGKLQIPYVLSWHMEGGRALLVLLSEMKLRCIGGALRYVVPGPT